MYIIKRHVKPFNLDLEFDGHEVRVLDGDKVLDSTKVEGFRKGAKKMKEMEREMHMACSAMC